MATYKEIQTEFKKRYGKTIKTCWIAEIKFEHGLTRGKAPNRLGSKRVYPCPKNYRTKIEDVLRYFDMI
jgi:hypothetical protein|tara:strand:- start:65 stop:271 length:207 start_codon:yes stop_codon:yes gene_type:complete